MNTSFYIKNNDDVIKFHIKVEGKEKVKIFHENHKEIVLNREVYIAYLQKYFKGNEDDFIKLLK